MLSIKLSINMESHPLRVRGLKQFQLEVNHRNSMSHPLRVRGLKPRAFLSDAGLKLSHPLRVRGLKHVSGVCSRHEAEVASFTGAWIETSTFRTTIFNSMSHPLRVRGLKPLQSFNDISNRSSHPLRVRGLKPFKTNRYDDFCCRILYGCVD